jgi:hypothetical protein
MELAMDFPRETISSGNGIRRYVFSHQQHNVVAVSKCYVLKEKRRGSWSLKPENGCCDVFDKLKTQRITIGKCYVMASDTLMRLALVR